MSRIETRKMNCPACGAPILIESAFTRSVVCPYCDTTSFLEDKGLDPGGKMAKLSQAPSIFALGCRGSIAGRPFKVLGRLRYGYEDGFWDEWFVQFDDGQAGWITEEEGECAIFFKELLTSRIAGVDNLRAGRTIRVNDLPVFVTEICEAEIAGGEGELHYRIIPHTPVRHIEGNAGGQLVSIEIWPREIEVHRGHPLDYQKIKMEKGEEQPY